MSCVLIVGANSDVAKACARVYASSGHNVMLTVREKGQVNDFAGDLEIRYGCQVKVVHLDIMDIESHAQVYQQIKDEVCGVICAVGYLGDQLLSQKNRQEMLTIVNTNFTGVIHLLSIIANDFEKRRAGFIVALSSVAGERGRKKNYTYGAAKAGLTAYLSGLRNRLFASEVSVLTVKPGFIETKMTEHLNLPAQLTAQPQDIAQAIYHAQKKGKDVLYYPRWWTVIMMVIRSIPEKIFKRLDL